MPSTLHSSPTACRRICTRGGDEDAGHQCRTANPSAKPMPKSVSFQNPIPPQRYLLFVQTKTIKAPQTITAALAMPAHVGSPRYLSALRQTPTTAITT